MALDHLWAGWRSAYVGGVVDARRADHADPAGPGGPGADGGGGSIFERILGSDLPDDELFVVHRGREVAALLNIYPYTSGHLMVLPNRAAPDLDDLTPSEHAELWEVVRASVVAVRAAFRCEGVNVGANLGAAAGAGIPEHVHVHVLPRWVGDTNFTTTVANLRVMPVSLDDSYRRLRAAWPST